MSVLMVSISGVRGIIGNGLDPEVLVKFSSAYAGFVGSGTIVVGRDSRITGDMVKSVVTGTLNAKGLNVVDIGICPTPTVQYTVKTLGAAGGIAISASHNPNEWNALKLLNGTGQFLSPAEYELLKIELAKTAGPFQTWDAIGKTTGYGEGIDRHLRDVLALPVIDVPAIRKRKFRVLADCVNGAGYAVVPRMLHELGCEVVTMGCDDSGIFPRLPEPLPENLTATMQAVREQKVDIGIVVDPDVDRLVLLTEKGEPFIEENTIAQAVRFILSKQKGDIVVNLSTTRAVEDLAAAAGVAVHRSAVGEANVVQKMKDTGAILGGEGSGGVIYPALHYGRDALVGIALTLQHLLEWGGTMSALKAAMPQYFIAKRKIELGTISPDEVLRSIAAKYKDGRQNHEDGLRIDFDDHWAHFRKSNTEPIIRVICEAKTQQAAEQKINGYFRSVQELM